MPRLVADNLERAIKTQAVAMVRQIGRALNFVVHGSHTVVAVDYDCRHEVSGQTVPSLFDPQIFAIKTRKPDE